MAKKADYRLFDKNSTAIIYGNQVKAVQRMLDFDYLCRRKKPSVSAVINPSSGEKKDFMQVFFGSKEILIPVYKNLADAVKEHTESDIIINFSSFRSAYETSIESLEVETVRTVVIIAEGIPERLTRLIAKKAKDLGKTIIGPATVGGFAPGQFKIGNAGGAISNLIETKLYRPGSVGFVSKSGGMLNEMANVISKNADGLYEGIAIGGDAYPGSTLLEHLLRYEANPDIKMMVLLGELGGTEEYNVTKAMKEGRITKPLVAWVTGTCAKIFPGEVQFGHAGALAKGESETADAKNAALADAGAYVPKSFNDLGDKIGEVYQKLLSEGVIQPIDEVAPPEMPTDLDAKKVRKPTHFVSTISDDSQEELLYAGVPISKVIQENYSLGDVIGLLWFKKKMPSFVTEFIEMAIKITADHGPCVSGAHNTIVTARAGKDLMSSLASGILTIGPRFGGAVSKAAEQFKWAYDQDFSPRDFVNAMKAKKTNISGIGHRVKSVKNPDMRVKLLIEWAQKNMPKHTLLDFALEVEKITTAKKGNLILNVDGCIGILFVDVLMATGLYTAEEVDNIIATDALNGLFVLGRTVGMIGHYLDQKRLGSKLYRHPWDDVLYMLPEAEEVFS